MRLEKVKSKVERTFELFVLTKEDLLCFVAQNKYGINPAANPHICCCIVQIIHISVDVLFIFELYIQHQHLTRKNWIWNDWIKTSMTDQKSWVKFNSRMVPDKLLIHLYFKILTSQAANYFNFGFNE